MLFSIVSYSPGKALVLLTFQKKQRPWCICFSLQYCLVAAAMLHASSILRILKGTCYLISICMIMLKHFTVKFAIKPSSSTHTHLFLLICTRWPVPLKLLFQGWRRNWKLWLLTTRFRYDHKFLISSMLFDMKYWFRQCRYR